MSTQLNRIQVQWISKAIVLFLPDLEGELHHLQLKQAATSAFLQKNEYVEFVMKKWKMKFFTACKGTEMEKTLLHEHINKSHPDFHLLTSASI